MERVGPLFVFVNSGFFLLIYSSARIFFGRGAVMAKALGTTTEEEHRLGLSKLAKVRFPLFFTPSNNKFILDPANKRPSRIIFHRYETTGSNRLVRRFPTARFRSCWQRCDANDNTPCRTYHETFLGPSRTVSA